MEAWVLEHMEGVLWTIEILWVGGVLVIFSLYFVLKWHFDKKKKTEQKSDLPKR